jgi:hypothetical protein
MMVVNPEDNSSPKLAVVVRSHSHPAPTTPMAIERGFTKRREVILAGTKLASCSGVSRDWLRERALENYTHNLRGEQT